MTYIPILYEASTNAQLYPPYPHAYARDRFS